MASLKTRTRGNRDLLLALLLLVAFTCPTRTSPVGLGQEDPPPRNTQGGSPSSHPASPSQRSSLGSSDSQEGKQKTVFPARPVILQTSKASAAKPSDDVFGTFSLDAMAMTLPSPHASEKERKAYQRRKQRNDIKEQFYSLAQMFFHLYETPNLKVDNIRQASLPSGPRIISKRNADDSIDDVFNGLPVYAMYLPADATREERDRVLSESQRADSFRDQFRTLSQAFINLYRMINP
ncbi:hypothetical protein ACOMHN_067594 [Nucella lapillus]